MQIVTTTRKHRSTFLSFSTHIILFARRCPDDRYHTYHHNNTIHHSMKRYIYLLSWLVVWWYRLKRVSAFTPTAVSRSSLLQHRARIRDGPTVATHLSAIQGSEQRQMAESSAMTTFEGKQTSSSIPGILVLASVPLVWGTYVPIVRLLYDIDPPIPGYLFSAAYFGISAVTTTVLTNVVLSDNDDDDDEKHATAQPPPKLRAGGELGTWIFLGNTLQILGLETVPSDRAGFLVQCKWVYCLYRRPQYCPSTNASHHYIIIIYSNNHSRATRVGLVGEESLGRGRYHVVGLSFGFDGHCRHECGSFQYRSEQHCRQFGRRFDFGIRVHVHHARDSIGKMGSTGTSLAIGGFQIYRRNHSECPTHYGIRDGCFCAWRYVGIRQSVARVSTGIGQGITFLLFRRVRENGLGNNF